MIFTGVYHRLSVIDLLESHGEPEGAALVWAVRLRRDSASCLLYNLLAYSEAEADTFTVHVCSALKFAEFCEQGGHVLSCDPRTSVLHRYVKHVRGWPIIKHLELDGALLGELDSVADQVHNDLLEAPLISNQSR